MISEIKMREKIILILVTILLVSCGGGGDVTCASDEALIANVDNTIKLSENIALDSSICLNSGQVFDGNGYEIKFNNISFGFLIKGHEVKVDEVKEMDVLLKKIYLKNTSALKTGDYIRIEDLNERSEFNVIENVGLDYVILANEMKWQPQEQSTIYLSKPVEDVVINNVTVSDSRNAVTILNGRNVIIKNSRFKNIAVDIIDIENSISVKVSNSEFFNNGLAGNGSHSVHSESSFGTVITDSKTFSSGPLWIRYDNYAVIKNNKLNTTYPTNGDAISITGSNNTLIENNTIENSNCYGVWVKNDSSHNTIRGNEISKGITSGIYVTNNSNDNYIIKNVVHNNMGNGIFIEAGTFRNELRENITYANESRGVLIHTFDYVLDGNYSYGNLLQDIFINP